MKFEEIGQRDRKREEGAWVDRGFRDLPGLALKVRGEGNTDYDRRASELYASATVDERAAPGFDIELTKKLLVETILVDWNVEDRPFSREAAKEAVEIPTFRQAVIYASRVVAALGTATLEADAGN